MGKYRGKIPLQEIDQTFRIQQEIGQTFRIQRETGQIIRTQRNLSHVRVKSRDVFKVVQLTFLYVK